MKNDSSKDRGEQTTEIVVFLAAISASMVSTWATLRHTFSSFSKSLGLFKDIEKIRDDKLTTLNNKPKGLQYWNEARDIREEFTEGVSKIYKSTGISENAVIGSFNKFQKLGTTGRLKVAGVGITVALGSMFSLLNLTHRNHVDKVLDTLVAKDKQTPQR